MIDINIILDSLNNDSIRKTLDIHNDEYVFDTQIDAAKDIVRDFNEPHTRRNHVILTAKMQSGKTGVCNSVVNIISQTEIESEMAVKRYIFVTGMNDCGLKRQTSERLKKQVIGATDDNIYIKKRNGNDCKYIILKNSDLPRYTGTIDNSVIFIDESHYGSGEKNVLTAFFKKNNIDWKNRNELISRNIYIVSVSATPFKEIVSDTALCKDIISLKTDSNYFGITDFITNGLIQDSQRDDVTYDGRIFSYICDAYDRMKIDGIYGVIFVRSKRFEVFKNNDYVKDKFRIVDVYSNGSNIDYRMIEREMEKLYRINNLNNLMSKSIGIIKDIKDIDRIETKPILFLIKGAFRAGITIKRELKDIIYMVYDHSTKSDTTVQALIGRMCGYRDINAPVEKTKFYVNKKYADMYSTWEQDFSNRANIPSDSTKYDWVDGDYQGKDCEFGSKPIGNIAVPLSDDEVREIIRDKDTCRTRVGYAEKILPELLRKHNIDIQYDYIGEAVLKGKNKYSKSTINNRFEGFSEYSSPYIFRPDKVKRFVENTGRDYITEDDIGTKIIYVVLDSSVDSNNRVYGNNRLLIYRVEVSKKIKVVNHKGLYQKHKDTSLI